MREFVFYSGLQLIHLSTARLCRCETTSLYRQHAIQNSKHYSGDEEYFDGEIKYLVLLQTAYRISRNLRLILTMRARVGKDGCHVSRT